MAMKHSIRFISPSLNIMSKKRIMKIIISFLVSDPKDHNPVTVTQEIFESLKDVQFKIWSKRTLTYIVRIISLSDTSILRNVFSVSSRIPNKNRLIWSTWFLILLELKFWESLRDSDFVSPVSMIHSIIFHKEISWIRKIFQKLWIFFKISSDFISSDIITRSSIFFKSQITKANSLMKFSQFDSRLNLLYFFFIQFSWGWWN